MSFGSFFFFTSAFLGFTSVLTLTIRPFSAFFYAVSFRFYACFSAFSSALTSLIFSSLTTAYKAFAAFSALSLCFLRAMAAFFILIHTLSDFSNASFSAKSSCAHHTLSAEKSTGFICSSPKTFSRFPRTLLFFSSFNALKRPSFIYRSSAACVASSLLALKSFSSFAYVRFLR
jgi:hypothetical protein